VPQVLSVIGPRSGSAPVSYEVTERGSFDLQSIFASFNGAAAGAAFRPVVTIRSQNGDILARVFPSDTVAAGDTADVTFAPFLGGAGGGADTDAIHFGINTGSELTVETQTGSITFEDEGGDGIELFSRDGGSGGHVNITAVGGNMDLNATLFLLDMGHASSGGVRVRNSSIQVVAEFDPFGGLTLTMRGGGWFSVLDASGDPIFEVRDDGSVHILTGTSIVADL
jgi:hypothetical protein